MSRQLVLDGMDFLREELDLLGMRMPEWVFMAADPGPPHPIGAVQVTAYNPDRKLSAGIVMPESAIIQKTPALAMLRKLEGGIKQSEETYGRTQ